MELKVLCNCGQKYASDVEPVDNQMPHTVNCPACGADGTSHANALITQSVTSTAAPPPLPRAGVTARVVTRPPAAPGPVQMKKIGEFNLGMGILGGFLGALLAAGLMVGISMALGFRFPLFGTAIGALAGLGAKWLYKGTDSTLGVITAVIALAFTTGALCLIFGGFQVTMIISMAVSASFAWKISSG